MIYRSPEGAVLSTKIELFDDIGDIIRCRPGYPKVALVDEDKLIISSTLGTPGQIPGEWFADLAIPNLGLTNDTELTLRWRVQDLGGDKYTFKDAVIVEPQVDVRETDIVAMFGDQNVSFVLPMVLSPGDYSTYQIYANNIPVFLSPVNMQLTNSVHLDKCGIDTTRVTIPLVVPAATMYANLLKVDVFKQNTLIPQTFIYKLWAITPQLLMTMSYLEDFLNKSRIENVIPELRYTTGDLIGYLQRGLNMFNLIEKPTNFTGLNMQGPLGDAHLICSQYYALSAQLLAEGSLAFDFSGQGVTLNVDRTPQLEGALGRMEALMDSRIVPLKKELLKNGMTGGDGSLVITGFNNPQAKGMLSLMNAATTRLSNPMGRFLGRRR